MEDDDDYLPDFLKEDSVVESPLSLDDMVMPSDYEWTYLNDDFSVESILKLNKEGKNQGLNLTGNQMWALDKIKDNLYNWDNEPGFSDIFHKEFCKKYGISLSILKALEKKGLIKLSKDDYYFKERGYIVYPKPLMYLVYISNQDYPDWFIRGSKEMGLWKAESKKINPLEKAGITGVASGATMEGLETLMAAEDFMGWEYYFLVDTDGNVTNDFSSLEDAQIARSYVPNRNLKIMRRRFDGKNMAGTTTEVTGFDPYKTPNYFKNNYHSEGEELSEEQLRDYFARLKDKNPKLAKEIEYSIKEQGYVSTENITKAGFNPSHIEAWADLVADEEKYAPLEPCPECEGEGYVLTSYTSATRFDPADGDGEDCGGCGGTGEIDPADYMYSNDGEVDYLAETFEAKSGKRMYCPKCKTNRTWNRGFKKHNMEPGENPYDFVFYVCQKCNYAYDPKTSIEIKDWKTKYGAETFDVEFNEWADQELMSHGKDISFKDWAEDEGMKHGNTEITDWAQHEDESHDARYGAETLDDMKIKYDNRDRTFFIKSVDYDTDGEIENDKLPQEFTIKIPSDYHYFDENADEGDITDVLNEWISTETGFSTKGIVWIEEESNSWRKNAETKLSKTSCCCGADEANPCACMKAPEPMNCSAKAPKCACYKALEKNAEFLYFYVLNEKGESPADFNTLEEAQTYVANSSEPLEIYERRSRDDEAYKMDKKMNAEYDEEDMVYCNHCSDIVGNEKEVYGDETVEYEMANGELVCLPCHKIWMKEYKNDLDPHYSPFYAEEKESILNNTMFQAGSLLLVLTLIIHLRKR